MNSTETKTELPISKVREAVELLIRNNLGPTMGPVGGTCLVVRSQDYCALEHYLRAEWTDDALRTRLEAVEKGRDELKALVNSKVIASVVEDKLGQNLMVRKITALEKANGELVAALKQCSDLLRAVRYSMDRDVPFPSLEKINAGIATAEAMKGEG